MAEETKTYVFGNDGAGLGNLVPGMLMGAGLGNGGFGGAFGANSIGDLMEANRRLIEQLSKKEN